MLLEHAHPDCTGRWGLRRDDAGRSEVACGACGTAYPRSAWAEDAGEREHELERLLAFLEGRGRALLAGRKTSPRWT